jgi:hypothetical protein
LMSRHGDYQQKRKHDSDDDVVELEPFTQAETA